jgi:hypothetical protein
VTLKNNLNAYYDVFYHLQSSNNIAKNTKSFIKKCVAGFIPRKIDKDVASIREGCISFHELSISILIA